MECSRLCCKFCIKIGASANANANAKICICICTCTLKSANESANANICICVCTCSSKSANAKVISQKCTSQKCTSYFWTKVHLMIGQKCTCGLSQVMLEKSHFQSRVFLNAYEAKKLTCSYKHNSKNATTLLHFSCTCAWQILPFLQKYKKVIVNVNYIQILHFSL